MVKVTIMIIVSDSKQVVGFGCEVKQDESRIYSEMLIVGEGQSQFFTLKGELWVLPDQFCGLDCPAYGTNVLLKKYE
jgi:hypothetical protein